MLTKIHYHFLLSKSAWPFLISIGSFNLLFSLLLFFKFNFFLSFFFGTFLLIFLSMLWWIFYSSEFSVEGKDSLNLDEGIKFGMILFISSEVFFFFSFFWSYFHFYLSPLMEISLSWPPVYIEMFDYSNVPLINTMILMVSGVTVTLSHFFLYDSKVKLCSLFLILTFLLGFIFTYLQWMEYQTSFFNLTDSTFGSSFFLLTGFHGIHVVIGSIFLLTVFFIMVYFFPLKFDFVSFDLASWYWHFVDVVWLFLYFCLYYLNN